MQNNYLKENTPDLCEDKKETCPPQGDIDAMLYGKQAPEQAAEKSSLFKHRILNISVLLFTLALTVVSLITFFIAFARGLDIPDYMEAAYAIASTYILCMLLAAPTLKVFLDKCTSAGLKKFNIITLVAIFVAIFVLAAAISIGFIL